MRPVLLYKTFKYSANFNFEKPLFGRQHKNYETNNCKLYAVYIMMAKRLIFLLVYIL